MFTVLVALAFVFLICCEKLSSRNCYLQGYLLKLLKDKTRQDNNLCLQACIEKQMRIVYGPRIIMNYSGIIIGFHSRMPILFIIMQRDYNSYLSETLSSTTQSYRCWSALQFSLFGANSSIPVISKSDGSVPYIPQKKADLLSLPLNSK